MSHTQDQFDRAGPLIARITLLFDSAQIPFDNQGKAHALLARFHSDEDEAVQAYGKLLTGLADLML